MKKIIIFILISFSLYAQTTIENSNGSYYFNIDNGKIVATKNGINTNYSYSIEFTRLYDAEKSIFNKINLYRKSKNVHPIIFSDGLCIAGSLQAEYCIENNILEHIQEVNRIDNTTPFLKSPKSRVQFLQKNNIDLCVIENLYKEGSITTIDEETIANDTMNGWKKSKKHDEGMLMKEVGYYLMKYGGVSCYQAKKTTKIDDEILIEYIYISVFLMTDEEPYMNGYNTKKIEFKTLSNQIENNTIPFKRYHLKK